MHLVLSLVQTAVESFLESRLVIRPTDDLPVWLLEDRKGVFVSFYTYGGALRGFAGSLHPTKANLAEELIHASISAAVKDRSFLPVSRAELPGLKLRVDIVESVDPLPINKPVKKVQGLCVESLQRKTDVLLPGTFPLEDTKTLVVNLCHRAKIDVDADKYRVLSFKTKTFTT